MQTSTTDATVTQPDTQTAEERAAEEHRLERRPASQPLRVRTHVRSGFWDDFVNLLQEMTT